MMETPAPRLRTRSNDLRPSRPFSQSDLQSHPLLRRGSSEPGNMQTSTTELVVLNRTSSFSRITYELNETVDIKPAAGGGAQAPALAPKPPSSHLGARLGILLSRSSGRDKFAALVQYFSMFCGHQTLARASQDAHAPWRNVEESMSSGRKVLRLLKWTKELERVQRSVTHEDIGPHATRVRALAARVLGSLMHSFSALYYIVDNVIWASQVGLVNRPAVAEPGAFRKMLGMDLPMQEYIVLQHRHRADEALRAAARAREQTMKDLKNYASFCRLVLCIGYCALQLDSIRKEHARLVARLRQVLDGASGQEDEEGEEEDGGAASRRGLVARTQAQFADLDDLRLENRRELWAAVCNLFILLRRLELGGFARLPLWSVGLLGMASAWLGLQKNWPVVA